jgi:hypothetical protein
MTTNSKPNRIIMHRSATIDGVPVVFSRSICGWVAVLGPEYAVHFHKPKTTGGPWTARRPVAQENLCTGRSLTEVFRKARAHYEARLRESRRLIRARLVAAQLALDPDAVSFKVGVKTDGDRDWVFNALRFRTDSEAGHYGADLACRWTAVREVATFKCNEPVNYSWDQERGALPIEAGV